MESYIKRQRELHIEKKKMRMKDVFENCSYMTTLPDELFKDLLDGKPVYDEPKYRPKYEDVRIKNIKIRYPDPVVMKEPITTTIVRDYIPEKPKNEHTFLNDVKRLFKKIL
jgi:hypothetical protein